MRITKLFAIMIWAAVGLASGAENPLPAFDQLTARPELPDPLQFAFSDRKVTTRDEWFQQRRPELKLLIQHYMYGYFPPAPEKVEAKIVHENAKYLDGKATLRVLTLHFGPEGVQPIQVLLVTPNDIPRAPVFLGVNFCGNHALVDDPNVPLVQGWIRNSCAGCANFVATEQARGTQKDTWPIPTILARGYALAAYYHGDLDPDRDNFEEGIHRHYLKPGQSADDPHRWGTIAAWAWGMQRVVDYLVTDSRIDATKIAAVGHSRLGKTSLVAGAYDDRIALMIPHQAGCGGTAPSRGKIGEPVHRINKVFPHWFSGSFKWFNEQPEKLPFDQNCLLALCAPRPVLFSNAVDDQWANPSGQFEVMKAAESVYKLLGAEGLNATAMPEPGKLVNSNLGYFYRNGKHSMIAEDWEAFLAFADKHLLKK